MLQINNISKNFEKFSALSDLSFNVPRGKITALIGPNGAGKSTLFNIISGHRRPNRGNIILDDKNITGFSPHTISSLGIGRTFQTPSLFQNLTVKQNIIAAYIVQNKRTFKFLGIDRKSEMAADLLIDKMHLTEFANIPIAFCPYGIGKELEIALAIATEPKLLLMDEPTAGIARTEVSHIINRIKNLCEQEHITVFFTEHDISFVLSIASKIVVLNQGKLIFEGIPKAAMESSKVKEIYLGKDA